MRVELKKDRFKDGTEEFYVVIDNVEYRDLNKASIKLTKARSEFGGIFTNSLIGYTERFTYDGNKMSFKFEPIDYKNDSIFDIEKKLKERLLSVRCWIESLNNSPINLLTGI